MSLAMQCDGVGNPAVGCCPIGIPKSTTKADANSVCGLYAVHGNACMYVYCTYVHIVQSLSIQVRTSITKHPKQTGDVFRLHCVVDSFEFARDATR